MEKPFRSKRIPWGLVFGLILLGAGAGCDCTTLKNSGWSITDAPGYIDPVADADTGALICPPGKVLERWVKNSGAATGRSAKCRSVTDCDTGISKSGSDYVKKIACTNGSAVQCASKTVSVISQ
jgi:hypothetical protein